MVSLWTESEELGLAEYLVCRIRDHASGRLEPECLYNAPRDTYFLGNLRPFDESLVADPDAPLYLAELINKLAPVAFGADFLARAPTDELSISATVSWSCYYRVFPTLDQQRAHQQRVLQTGAPGATGSPIRSGGEASQSAAAATGPAPVPTEGDAEPDGVVDPTMDTDEELTARRAGAESPEVEESTTDRRRGRTKLESDSLAHRYRKIPCQATGRIVFRRDLGTKWLADPGDLQSALDDETARAQAVALADTERVQTAGAPHDRIRVPEQALKSEEAYRAFLGGLVTDVVPSWQWQAFASSLPTEVALPSDCLASIELTNRSPRQMPPGDARDHPNIESFFFDAEAEVTFSNGAVHPFELELAPRGFRHDRRLWGRGFNAVVEQDATDPQRFRVTHTPVYRQMRLRTGETPRATFADLATEPIPVLDQILSAMESSLKDWDEARAMYQTLSPDWDARSGPTFEEERAQFAGEIERFRVGRGLVENDPDVLAAFKLTNETFRRLGDHPRPEKRKDAWRLFQIVFLVAQVPGIAALAHPGGPGSPDREKVDIIFFPTGGGKTEAYLATIVFHAFFDRLRGKRAGVTAWTRFPLRLLTIQQTQRMADVIGIAELVRAEQQDPRLTSGASFSVGYFVGKRGTPNELVNPDKYHWATSEARANWAIANDSSERQRWRSVLTCPSCRTQTVSLDFDPAVERIIHRCGKAECAFLQGHIPVYVVDNDLYRYLPTVIVGTIDKLASLGNQRKVAQLFGHVDGVCPKHGFYKAMCPQRGCTEKLRPGTPAGLSGPTLFVQDELHLLKEGLGTFDAHYETFVQELLRRLGGTESAPLKIIASSATVEAFERQVEHLYGRGRKLARVFPGPGPWRQASFYAETVESPQRLYVGLIPHNKTIFNAVLELIELYHREIQLLQRLPASDSNPYGGSLAPASEAWFQLLDLYATSLTYFLANRELDSIHTDIEGDVNPNLERDRMAPLRILTLTGGTETDEVIATLDRLESSAGRLPAADAVLATSMISHGVDIDRLNAMLFYGMPRQTAEYIQASSRVGRAHVGIVLTCLHPARERDQSHYDYFNKYHEFLGQLVEPVAINRWAKFSIDRTLPGLFMAVLLQLIANRPGETRPNRYYMLDFVRGLVSSGALTPDAFVPVLEQAYLVSSPSSTGEQTFRDEIAPAVRKFLYDQIGGAGIATRFVSEALYPKPMASLRDVDVAVPIEIDADGDRWASRSTRVGEGH